MNPARPPARAADRLRLRVLVARCAAVVVIAVAGTLAAASTTAQRGAPALGVDNLVHSPSFESGTDSWSGTHLTRVFTPEAPDGSFVARVSTLGGKVSLDDWPGSVTATTAGTTYRASVSIAAASPSALGERVGLVLREHAADGTEVASWSAAADALTAGFHAVQVSGTAHRNADYLDVYVHEDRAAPGDAMYADAFVVTAHAPMPITNEIRDPSFEQAEPGDQGPPPWGGIHGTERRVRTADAPDGAEILEVTADRSGSLSFVDRSDATTARGEKYEASALVAAANRRTRGQQVRLAIEERTPDGSRVARFVSPPTGLSADYQRLVIDGHAARNGDRLDVEVLARSPSAGESLRLDALSLAAAPSTLAELAVGTSQADALGDTSRYRYVTIQENQYAHIAQITAANPHTAVFAYLDAAVVHQHDCNADPPSYGPHDSFGVDYCYVVAHHPDWILRDRSGNPLTYADYPDEVVMDIGQPGYRRLWGEDAAAAARADGFDGIYLDDVNTRPGHGLDGRIARYTDIGYGNAMVGFVAAATGLLSAHGLESIANVGASPWVRWQFDDAVRMSGHLTAVNEEFYTRWGTECGPYSPRPGNPDALPSLRHEQIYQTTLEARGAALTGVDRGASPATPADLAAMSYGRAAFLLTWNGRPGSAYAFRPCGAVDPADPAWTTELGLPTAAPRSVGGAWLRSYTRGVAVLNPSPTEGVTVPLDGSYVTPDKAPVSGSATLAPRTALLLTRTGYS